MKQIALLIALVSGTLMAQNEKLQFKRTLEIEVDPIAYVMKGYSVHGIYNHNHFRYDLGVYGIETPGKLTGNKDYQIRNTGFGLKANYMIGKVNGLYAGIDAGYGQTKATQNESKLSDLGHNISIGTHVGYRLFLFPNSRGPVSGIYLTPWAGISYNHTYDKIQLPGYKDSKLGYFATFHVGYRF